MESKKVNGGAAIGVSVCPPFAPEQAAKSANISKAQISIINVFFILHNSFSF